MKGYCVRSRAPLMCDDEPASTFHVKEEKRRARLSNIVSIKRPDGTTVDDAKLVDEELTRHFTAALTIHNDRDQPLDGLFGEEVSGRVVDCDFLLLPYTAPEL